MSDYIARERAENDRKKQTAALEAQAKAMEEQNRLLEEQNQQQRIAQARLEANQRRQIKNEKRERNKQAGKTNFHGLYFLFLGWWLSIILICLIFPLFFQGGRSLIKKAFGFW